MYSNIKLEDILFYGSRIGIGLELPAPDVMFIVSQCIGGSKRRTEV